MNKKTTLEQCKLVDPGHDMPQDIWEALCDEQPNDSYHAIYYDEDDDSEEGDYLHNIKKVAKWLIKKGLMERAETVIVSICW